MNANKGTVLRLVTQEPSPCQYRINRYTGTGLFPPLSQGWTDIIQKQKNKDTTIDHYQSMEKKCFIITMFYKFEKKLSLLLMWLLQHSNNSTI